jgi:elongation factor Ts
MAITALQVNELRQKTGAGMMDCKRALTEAEGDFEKAIEILRKKGAAIAAKRAEKSANEGLVLTKVSEDKSKGVIAEINCETDFVARSSDFISFAEDALNTIYTQEPSSIDALMDGNSSLGTHLNDLMGKIGEKIQVTRFSVDKANDGVVVDYIHPGSKLGVLVIIDNAADGKDEITSIARDIAMQVAAMKPICIYRDEVSQDLIDKEMDIYKELARKEGKPDHMLDKIAAGRLNKFFQENCLFEQAYIKDNSKTVSDLLKEFNTKHGTQAKLKYFRRFHLGDEKK